MSRSSSESKFDLVVMDYVMPGMNGAADPSQRLLSPSLTLSTSLSRHTWLVACLIRLVPVYYRC